MPQETNPWNEIFKQQGKVFLEPHEDMPGIVRFLSEQGARKILDLGSGSGRHVLYLAKCGFSVSGLDNSPEGIEITRDSLRKERLAADLQLRGMTERLPYEDASFDAVISVQVIHHAEIATIRDIIREIARVLRKDGFIYITVPRMKNQAITFREIEPGTFVPLDGLEKDLPHHYFTPEELREVFEDFRITDIHLDSTEHYCLSALKP